MGNTGHQHAKPPPAPSIPLEQPDPPALRKQNQQQLGLFQALLFHHARAKIQTGFFIQDISTSFWVSPSFPNCVFPFPLWLRTAYDCDMVLDFNAVMSFSALQLFKACL